MTASLVTGVLSIAAVVVGVVVGGLLADWWSAPSRELVELLWPTDRVIDTTPPTTTELNVQETP